MLNELIAGGFIIIAIAFIGAVLLVVGWLVAAFVLSVARIKDNR